VAVHAESTASSGAAPLLAARGLDKRFGDVQANADVSFEVTARSIHAVVGENGAGKTTLMRMIYGLYAPDDGHIELDGERVSFSSPRDALAHGIAMVHQHSLLVGSLTVAENVLLALPGLGRAPRQAVTRRLRALAKSSGLDVDPTRAAAGLSVAARQRAEILSALFHEARLLILDEPTTVLTPQEVSTLFAVLHSLRAAGTTIAIVTHKLKEVMAISDRVTVMRGGRVVATVATPETNERELVRMMVGRDVPLRVTETQASRGGAASTAVLRAERLHVTDDAGIERVAGIDFAVAPGEILAITGVEGNGQTELTEALVGMRPVRGGEIYLKGRPIRRWAVGQRRRAGLGYIPEDRLREGVSPEMSVSDNLVLGRHRERRFGRFGLRNLHATAELADQLVADYHVVPPVAAASAATLSGGNLQKVLVAREASKNPDVLIAAQPTQGVDVAAAHMIRSTLLDLRNRGVAVLLVSADLGEVCDLADRALVMYNGQAFGELSREELTEEAIGSFAMGVAR
jgi:general nucleoside transport system ATP-binding protein